MHNVCRWWQSPAGSFHLPITVTGDLALTLQLRRATVVPLPGVWLQWDNGAGVLRPWLFIINSRQTLRNICVYWRLTENSTDQSVQAFIVTHGSSMDHVGHGSSLFEKEKNVSQGLNHKLNSIYVQSQSSPKSFVWGRELLKPAFTIAQFQLP